MKNWKLFFNYFCAGFTFTGLSEHIVYQSKDDCYISITILVSLQIATEKKLLTKG